MKLAMVKMPKAPMEPIGHESLPIQKRNPNGTIAKGNIPWLKGKHPEAHNKGVPQTKEAVLRGVETRKKNGSYKNPWNKGLRGFGAFNKGRKWTIEQRIRNSGQKHHSWDGGKTRIQTLIRNSYEYRQWVSDVFTRDKFTCCFCGKVGGNLNAHHIKPFSKIIANHMYETIAEYLAVSELWDINNGKTLCVGCHHQEHRRKNEISRCEN